MCDWADVEAELAGLTDVSTKPPTVIWCYRCGIRAAVDGRSGLGNHARLCVECRRQAKEQGPL
jgi:hypothetical protein